MSVVIKGNDVIFNIPNSEAIIDVQRVAIKMRSVCSFYLSNKQDDVEKALNGLSGNFYVDLLYSYKMCNDFFQNIIKISGHLYRDGLICLSETLKSLENLSNNYPSQLFFRTANPQILASRKYLKLPGNEPLMSDFRYLCLGDVTDIVFQRLSNDTFRIFVRPRKDIKDMIKNPKKLNEYFASLRKANK